MKAQFVLPKKVATAHNIFSDKSALVLYCILEHERNSPIGVREIALESKVSIGLVQRVFEQLTLNGFLKVEGLRTAKTFKLSNPSLLLKEWQKNYAIGNRCKIWTYRTGLQNSKSVLQKLSKSKISANIDLALHAAARAYKAQISNLDTTEIYVDSIETKKTIEKELALEQSERGYDVLLISPYYKSILKEKNQIIDVHGAELSVAPPILTYLDLYHFALRGQEQAEALGNKMLKNILGSKK